MTIQRFVKLGVNYLLSPMGLKLVKAHDLLDFVLFQYRNYDHYKDVQIHHNLKKQSKVWADEYTLREMCRELQSLSKGKTAFSGICHGTRNGFEQRFISSLQGFDAVGTDISPACEQYERSTCWDFHNPNPDWMNHFDFVYSNSLDQSWNPKLALSTWLGQIKPDGYVVIELTEAHGPKGASEMDPFGVKPIAFPYVVAEWFGHNVSTSFVKGTKANNNLEVWLYFIRRV